MCEGSFRRPSSGFHADGLLMAAPCREQLHPRARGNATDQMWTLRRQDTWTFAAFLFIPALYSPTLCVAERKGKDPLVVT